MITATCRWLAEWCDMLKPSGVEITCSLRLEYQENVRAKEMREYEYPSCMP
jgi:hypothetical protein